MLNRIVFLILIYFYSYNSVLCQSNLSKANQAMNMVELYEAENLYNIVFNDINADSSDRIAAANKLIYLNIKFKNDFSNAREIAEKALILKKLESGIYFQLASVYFQKEYFDSALVYVSKSLKNADSYSDSIDAFTLQALIVLNKSMCLLSDRQNVDYDGIKKTSSSFHNYDKNESMNFDYNYSRIGLYLLTGQGNEALKAWKLFFMIGDSIPEYLGIAYNDLNSVLKDWNNTPLDQFAVNKLILGLAHSRLYDFASMIHNLYSKNDKLAENNEIIDIIYYQKYLKDSRILAYDFYNKVILDKKNTGKYKKEFRENLNETNKKLWYSLSRNGIKLGFNNKKFKHYLDKQFGLKLIDGNTNGYPALVGGHVISQDIRTVNQYGRKCKFKMYSVDLMHSNDLLGYFLDDFVIGGWANNNEVVQVRQKYLSFIENIYTTFNDSILRNELLSSINRQLVFDDSAVSKNPVCDLPGLTAKMMYDEISFIYDSIKNKAVSNEQLKLDFIATVNGITTESSIIAHEGRHKLDYKYKPWLKRKPSKLEYNAKISEIIFCRNPFLMLSKIMVYNPDAIDPHGKASAQITLDLYNWMEKHKPEIKNFDFNKPTLLQVQLLSNAQLIEAMQSFDVWSKNR